MEEIEPGKWQGSLNNVDAWTEFKFRWNHDWNYAILGADSVSNETVAVTPGVPLNLANPGGNIRIEESGSYDPATVAVTVTTFTALGLIEEAMDGRRREHR